MPVPEKDPSAVCASASQELAEVIAVVTAGEGVSISRRLSTTRAVVSTSGSSVASTQPCSAAVLSVVKSCRKYPSPHCWSSRKPTTAAASGEPASLRPRAAKDWPMVLA